MSIVEKVKSIATEQVKDSNYSLYDVEYVKEGSDYFLLSEKLAEELDKEDFISDKYYLEVSSPGIERDLRDLEEVTNSVGKHVYIKTYEKIDNQKEFYGDILSVDGDEITIEYKDKARVKKSVVKYEKIAKIRLAVKF